MRVSLFFRVGAFICRFRIAIILLWLGVVLCCTPFISNIVTPFQATGFVALHSESANTDAYLNKELGYYANQLIVVYHSKQLVATERAFIDKLKYSLSGLKNSPLAHEIIYPSANKKQISKDKHTAYAVILFKGNEPIGHDRLMQLQAAIKKPKDMTMLLGGESVFVESINRQTEKDLSKADLIATPVSIITLILVFGTIIAALIPIVLGGGCALIILTTLYFIGHVFSLSIFTLNIAMLLGLCLSLDYSLFIINRFRDELRASDHLPEVIGMTLATAGKAVFFSGLAVFISLSALLLFPIDILFSVGIGGLAAVFFAVAIATTLLPAVLAVLKNGVNRLPVHLIKQHHEPEEKLKTRHFWLKLAVTVVHRPWFFFISILLVLLCLGYPFLHARFGISDFRILPEHSESRQFFNAYQSHFNQHTLAPIVMVVTAHHGEVLSRENLEKLHDLTRRLEKNPHISQVNSIVTTEPKLSVEEYHALYHSAHQPKSVRQLLKTTTTKKLTVINVVSRYDANSDETKALVRALRTMNPGKGLTMQLTGVPVNNLDVMDSIAAIFPYAVVWVMALTYLVLLILLRSLFLPLKAILMNVLSLSASYGVLVFIFQDGHLHQYLDFNVQGMLDISLLIIIFCALFGFSMDYEVFLLTRIQEYYRMTHDNQKSVIFGIIKSSRIITSAAIIVIFICGSFMVADVLMVKEFGLGIAVAIFVDAFLIRTILVPATMVLVNQWNWYLPAWLDKILPKSKHR